MVFGPGETKVRLHVPAETVAVHETVPSETVTFPNGVPTPGETTLTAQLIAKVCPTVTTGGIELAFVIVVVVFARLTSCPPARLPALARNTGSPL